MLQNDCFLQLEIPLLSLFPNYKMAWNKFKQEQTQYLKMMAVLAFLQHAKIMCLKILISFTFFISLH